MRPVIKRVGVYPTEILSRGRGQHLVCTFLHLDGRVKSFQYDTSGTSSRDSQGHQFQRQPNGINKSKLQRQQCEARFYASWSPSHGVPLARRRSASCAHILALRWQRQFFQYCIMLAAPVPETTKGMHIWVPDIPTDWPISYREPLVKRGLTSNKYARAQDERSNNCHQQSGGTGFMESQGNIARTLSRDSHVGPVHSIFNATL